MKIKKLLLLTLSILVFFMVLYLSVISSLLAKMVVRMDCVCGEIYGLRLDQEIRQERKEKEVVK